MECKLEADPKALHLKPPSIDYFHDSRLYEILRNILVVSCVLQK